MNRQWHILRVSVGKETEVHSRFSCTPYAAYSPSRVIRVFNRKFRSWRKRVMPMLPGYVFVELDHPRRVARDALIGAKGFMRNSDMSYSVLTHKELEAVKLMEHQMLQPEQEQVAHPFKVGDSVKLNDDTLSALRAVVSKLNGSNELEVQVEMMGGIVKMTTSAERLVAA